MSEYGWDTEGADLPAAEDAASSLAGREAPLDIVPLSAITDPEAGKADELPIVASEGRGRSKVPIRETVTVIEPGEAAEQVPPLRTPLRWGPQEEKAARQREQLLEQIGHLHDPSGVRIEAIERFYDALELRSTGDGLIADRAHGQEIGRAVKEMGHEYMVNDHYNTRLGMSFVFRQPDDSVAIVETAHGHERGHATLGIVPPEPLLKRLLAGVVESYLDPRGRGNGDYLEEGFMRFLDAAREDVLGPNPEGRPMGTELFPMYYLPPQYQTSDADYYRYGALGLEVMFAQDPQLLDAMLASRSQPEVRAEVRDRINRFHPALFNSLTDIQHERNLAKMKPAERDLALRANRDNFRKGLGMVLGAAGVSWDDVPDVVGTTNIERIRDKAARYEQETGFRFRPS